MTLLNNSEILRSWEVNTPSWINAIQNKEIERRNLISSQVIVDIILAAQLRIHSPKPASIIFDCMSK